MKANYKFNHFQTEIYYGETLHVLFDELSVFSNKQQTVLFVANQVVYDKFYDQIMTSTQKAQSVFWYICPNKAHCNQLSELTYLLQYVEEQKIFCELTVIGFGNEGACQLANFFSTVSVLPINRLLMIPTSLSALASGLKAEAVIERIYGKPALQVQMLPEAILFDRLVTKKADYQVIVADFLFLLRVGILHEYMYLQELYVNYPDAQKLGKISYSSQVEVFIRLLQKEPHTTLEFGNEFSEGILIAEGSHLFSQISRDIIGILLQLIYSQNEAHFEFNCVNFIRWCHILGYPLEIPEQVLSTDLVEGIIEKNNSPIVLLKKMGEVGQKKIVKEQQLFEAIQQYREITEKISGGIYEFL